MSVSTLASTVAFSPGCPDLMERDRDWCARYAQQYIIYVERWVHDPYGLPVLERQVLQTCLDPEQAQKCFSKILGEGEYGPGRLLLGYTRSFAHESETDPRTDWDLGGEGGG